MVKGVILAFWMLIIGSQLAASPWRTIVRVRNRVVNEITLIPAEDDDWQLPSETVALGFGDCEDFGILIQYRLRRRGITVDLVEVWKDGKFNHIVIGYGDRFLDTTEKRRIYEPIIVRRYTYEAAIQRALEY